MARDLIAAAGAVTLALVLADAAAGQDGDDAPDATDASARTSPDDGRVTFPASFFAQYSPVTAFDMVERTPGFTLAEAEERRGFSGAAGNVLINGERPSTKNNLESQLRRIAASNVARVEVIRGGAARLEVRGQSVVANVVLVEGAGLEPTTTYQAELRRYGGGRAGYYFDATHSFRWNGVDVQLYLQLPQWQGRSFRDERLLAGDGSLLETRDEFGQEHYRDITGSIDLNWSPTAADTFNFRIYGYPFAFDFYEQSEVFDADGAPLRTEFGRARERDAYEAEFGGDWEHAFSPAFSFKLVALQRLFGIVRDERFETFSPTTGFLDSTDVFNERSTGESIARGAFNWTLNDRHTLEFGVEGAFNFLDNTLDITTDDGSGPQPLVLPVSDTRVEELRGEVFITDVWQASADLSIEFGVAFEASQITQTGDVAQERTFTFSKPRASATYSLNDSNQLRLILERDVAQLDFDEFASSVQVSDNNILLGNPDLEPERTWRARAEWERRFGERAVVTIAGFYDQVEFVQDLVPIAGQFDGPGNLGDGTRVGVELDATFPLDFIGLSNAVLETQFRRQHTRVDDPTTGEERSFSEELDWQFDVDFRQDIPSLDVAWGFDWHSFADEPYFRLRELRVIDRDLGDLDVFVETTRFDGMTLRLGVDSLLDPVTRRDRVFYTGTRASGVVERTEIQDQSFGPFIFVRATGTF